MNGSRREFNKTLVQFVGHIAAPIEICPEFTISFSHPRSVLKDRAILKGVACVVTDYTWERFVLAEVGLKLTKTQLKGIEGVTFRVIVRESNTVQDPK